MRSDLSKLNDLKAHEFLRAMPKTGNGLGLHRMLELCRSLANAGWLRQLNAIKITGSNGKGSVAAMVASILKELGIGAGLYTSPHLLKFNERITIDGRPISDPELANAVQWFADRQNDYRQIFPGDDFSAFEAFTAIALYYFSIKEPRILVVEAGIGGRYDPTRVVPGQIVGLTSLDLEHTALLGATLELIAYDKADLCPEGGTIVTGVADREILRRLRSYCALRGVTLRSIAEHSLVERVSFGETQMEIDLEVNGLSFSRLKVGLRGVHQITNVIVAISILQEWLKLSEPALSEKRFKEAVARGLISLQWNGRFERVHQNPDVLIDVGHTPDAIASLVKTVRTALPDKRILLVTGVSSDKKAEAIVRRLLSIADAVVCTRAYHKGSPVEKILEIVKTADPDIPCFAEPTIETAIKYALQYATANNMTVLVAGGLFLAIEARQTLAGEDPKDLWFF